MMLCSVANMDDWLGWLGPTFQLRKTTEAVYNVCTIQSKLLDSYKEGENFQAIAWKIVKLREVFTYLEYHLLAGWFWIPQKAVTEKVKSWAQFLLVCGTRGKKRESEIQGEMPQVNIPYFKFRFWRVHTAVYNE